MRRNIERHDETKLVCLPCIFQTYVVHLEDNGNERRLKNVIRKENTDSRERRVGAEANCAAL